jgi:ribosomal protein L11 methylase PrmA
VRDDSGATTELAIAAVRRHAGPGVSVLDAGCGDGAVAASALALGAQVRAIDRSAAAVRVARTRGIAAEEVKIEQATGAYDLVVANLWPDDLLPVALALTSLVRPEGVLFVTGWPMWQVSRILRAFPTLQAVQLYAQAGWGAVDLVAGGQVQH